VLVRRGARRLKLVLERDRRGGPAPDPPAPAPARTTVRRTSEDAFIVDRRQLVGAVDNMSGLLTQLRAVPEVEDGHPIGFRLFEIADESVFRDLGLHDGDVVQRVNGMVLADPASLLGFLQQLRDEPRVALDIVRAGTARTLVYDLR
jgi:general secretion pathway protein C